ncbi:diguanylate cyclase [Chloroflexota bacterium]
MIDGHKLADFTSKIHNLFGLQEQCRELMTLVTEATGCQQACLLFLDTDGKDFSIPFCAPESEDNPLSHLRLSRQNPIVERLRREKKLLTRERLANLPGFRQLREQDPGEIKLDEIELFMPLVSRDRLIGILVLGKKQSGGYSPEDYSLLEDIADRVAVSMEKEYLREQLSEREKELSALNRSSAIMTSSLDIQAIFGSFVREIRKVVDAGWAAVTLIEDSGLYFLALSSKIGSAWKVGERVAIKGTATEWVVTHKKSMVESDLSQQSQFVTAESHLKQGVHSIAYLPLIVKGRAIGSLIVASCQPNAYNRRHMILLEQLASQVAMPIENAQLYAEVAEKARIDELTGLLNRRSLDEGIASEINRNSRYGGVFSLIILDVDSLKAFNDNYGHLIGDELLRQIGGIIKKAIRGADQAFRYGGDEFAVLLPNTFIDAANRVAERIRKQVASEAIAGDIPVTASLGLASWPDNGRGASEVMAAADAALYHAKGSGGNQSHCAGNLQ